MIRTFSTARPSALATWVWRGKGVWVLAQTVTRPSFPTAATAEWVSIAEWAT